MTGHEVHPGEPDVRIYLLDSFRAEVDGVVVDESAWRLRKARSLVKILALTPGHRLHREQVMELLWPGADASAALNSLNQVLYAARHALSSASGGRHAPQTFIRHQDQVLSLLPDGTLWVDACQFERLAREAARTGDERLYTEALSLYHHDLLPDDRYEEWVIVRRRELRQHYIEALHATAAAAERNRDTGAAIEALQSVLLADPASEPAHIGLMRLYAATGRHQQAIQQYHELAAALDRELGTEPSQAVQELYRSIVEERQTGELVLPAMFDHRVIFGRDREVHELSAAVRAGLDGRGRVVLLSGEAGIGKTTLAEVVSAPLEEMGAAKVLWGRCHQDEGVPAYWPWVQVFREYIAASDPSALRQDLGRHAGVIRRIVPDIEEAVGPVRDGNTAGSSRFQLFDATASALKRMSGRQPLLLVFDDLHWADRSSLLLLDFLARGLLAHPLVVIGTYRGTDLGRHHPLHQVMSQILRRPENRSILLTGLSREDAALCMVSAAGARPPEHVISTIHGLTEGNPFFVREMARLLMHQGDLEPEAGRGLDSLTVPQGVREIMHQRLAGLSAASREVLDTCSVMGREFGVHVVERVTGMPAGDLVDLLDEAVESRILEEQPGEPGFYRFSHALIRETIYDDLGTARRTGIHGRIADVLEQLYAGNVDPHLAELAHHFYRATPRRDVARTVDYLHRAGTWAMNRVAFDEASGYFARALQVLDLATPVDYPRRCTLLLDLGDAQRGAGDSARSRETCLQAAMLARRLNMPQHLARAASTVAWASMEIRPFDEYVVRLLEEALEALGPVDSIYRVQVLGALVRALDYSGDVQRRARLGDEAVEVARRLNDPETLVHALEGRLKSVIRPDDLDQTVADTEEIIRLAGIVGDSYMAILGHWWRADAMLGRGDVAAADLSITVGTRLAYERAEPRRIWEALCYQTMRALLDGRFDDAERLAAEAVEVGQRPAPRPSWSTYIEHLFMIRREQGRLAELEAEVREQVSNYGAYPYYRALLGLLLVETGRPDEAAEILDRLGAVQFSEIPRDPLWLVTIAFLADLAYQLGNTRYAGILHDLLEPYAGRAIVPDGIQFCLGSTAYFAGLAAETVGQTDEAMSYYTDAIAMNEQIGALPYVARSLLASARLSTVSGVERQPHVARALDLAHSLGMSRLARQCISLQAELERDSAS